ncbi:MAG: YfcE family phosphodiesterase [Planctomycetota bacterium]|nr:YfcE family phosphodiesterase [Planctomycetota bacterium]
MTDSEREFTLTPVSAKRIGLLSDSHGEAARTGRALDLLLDRGADLLIHLGDLGSEAVVDRLAGLPAMIVLGNVDPPSLGRYAEWLGIAVDGRAVHLQVGGRRLAATHGHLEEVWTDLVATAPDYLLHGHTHEVRDERHGGIRFVNPGAVDRADRWTVAMLEPEFDRLEIMDIPPS